MEMRGMARVAVLLGGLSPERPVSLSSGAGCAAALERLGHEVLRVDPQNADWIAQLIAAKPDAVFNALHGEWGEDGRVQGVLDLLSLPYTHSGLLASAIAMDKDKSKAVFAQAGLPLAAGKLMNRRDAAKEHPMKPPYVIKPNAQGSSVGVFIVREGANRPPEQLLDPDWSFGEEVLVEEFVDGKELTTVVMHGRGALTVTEISCRSAIGMISTRSTPMAARVMKCRPTFRPPLRSAACAPPKLRTPRSAAAA